jgi:orotidine-5'-phosphate decarboxylase
MEPRDRLAFALDVPGGPEALRFVELLRESVGLFKVGLELFCAEGPPLVRAVAERGGAVFLDLKLHDIPATVGRSAARVAALGEVRFLTVHTGGGGEMLREAVRSAGPVGILGVTVLTSIDEATAAEAGLRGPVAGLAVHRAQLAGRCGCAGIVASPEEAAAIRAAFGPGLRIVTPGIRPEGDAAGDQKRTATPRSAIEAGADILVVGRPIRDAKDPAAAARGIVASIAAAAGRRAT